MLPKPLPMPIALLVIGTLSALCWLALIELIELLT